MEVKLELELKHEFYLLHCNTSFTLPAVSPVVGHVW